MTTKTWMTGPIIRRVVLARLIMFVVLGVNFVVFVHVPWRLLDTGSSWWIVAIVFLHTCIATFSIALSSWFAVLHDAASPWDWWTRGHGDKCVCSACAPHMVYGHVVKDHPHSCSLCRDLPWARALRDD
jgi:hypothetical protein